VTGVQANGEPLEGTPIRSEAELGNRVLTKLLSLLITAFYNQCWLFYFVSVS